jgi:hypothetical protein
MQLQMSSDPNLEPSLNRAPNADVPGRHKPQAPGVPAKDPLPSLDREPIGSGHGPDEATQTPGGSGAS